MKIEILMNPGCGHGAQAAALVADVVRASAPRRLYGLAGVPPRRMIEAAVRRAG